jgi:hypothetical protein
VTLRELPKDRYGKVQTFRDASARPVVFAFVSPFHDVHEVELPSGEKTLAALGARMMTAAEITEVQCVNDAGAWASAPPPGAEVEELRKQLEASRAEVARLVADFSEVGERWARTAEALRNLTAKHVSEEARVATDARVVELATAQDSAKENAS